MISRKCEYLLLGALERLDDYLCFYSTLYFQKLWFQLFPPISNLICRSQSTVCLPLLTPFILCHSDSVLVTARKSFTMFQEIAKKVYGANADISDYP
jgi:hypothetical protein